MRRVALAASVATVLLAPSISEAAPRVFSARATPIFQQTFQVTSASARTFSTTNLRTWSDIGCAIADTFMVVRHPNGARFASDDCNSSTRGSCVTAPGGVGTWTVTIFAAQAKPIAPSPGVAAAAGIPPVDPGRCGFANLTMNGATIARDFFFGGEFITVPSEVAGTFRVQTVHQAGGADDTTLYAFGASWQPLLYDNDSGVGTAAAGTVTLAPGAKLLVGSYSLDGGGRTRVVLDECTSHPDASPDACSQRGIDADGDSLSDALELELRTDPDDHDTDGDGIWDYYEVIGRVVGDDELELPRFGANPRRRDVFVELDRERNEAGNVGHLLDEADVDLLLEDPYLDLPQLPAAPDGTRAIFVHADTGHPCPNRPSLCGDWGGSEILPITWDDLRHPDVLPDHFSPARRGIFHYGFMTTGGSGQGGFGETTFYCHSRVSVAHELGHNLGLAHWGARDMKRLNSKPNYPSLMNYLWGGALPNITVGRGRFSEGLMPSLDGPIDERTWAAEGNPAYLDADPFFYDVDGSTVDLDRDGRLSPFGTVQTDVAPIDRGTTGDDPWPHLFGAHYLAAPSDAGDPTGGAAIAVSDILGGHWVHVFVPVWRPGAGWTPYYVRAFDGSGSLEWSSPMALPPVFGLSTGEASAEAYRRADGSPGVLLLFPGQDGRLRYLDVDLVTPGNGAWQPVPGWPEGVTARQATLEAVGDRITMVWRDASSDDQSSNVYSMQFDIPSGSWSAPVREPIRSRFTPGLALGPDEQLYLASITPTQDESGHQGGQIHLRHRSAAMSSGEWTLVETRDSGWELPAPPPAWFRQRLALELVPLRTSAGGTFPDGSSQFVVSWVRGDWTPDHSDDQDGWRWYRAALTGYVSASGLSLPSKVDWRRRLDKTGERPYPTHSIATAVVGGDLVSIYTATEWKAPQTLLGARFVPYASAVAPGFEGLVDSDDAIEMSSHMCTSVWNLLDGGAAACRCETGRACAGAVQRPLQEDVVSCE